MQTALAQMSHRLTRHLIKIHTFVIKFIAETAQGVTEMFVVDIHERQIS